MTAPLRLRLVGLLLALVMSLGGIAGALAQRMPTLDDLAAIEAMSIGATAADFCGKDGKAILSGATTHFCQTAAATILPTHRPALARLALRADPVVAAVPQLAAAPPLDPAHASRAPPSRLA